MGFKKSVIKWFKSYLLNRRFFVLLEGVFSEEGLIYINDLRQALSETASNLYVDDTCVYYQHKDIEKIETILNIVFIPM